MHGPQLHQLYTPVSGHPLVSDVLLDGFFRGSVHLEMILEPLKLAGGDGRVFGTAGVPLLPVADSKIGRNTEINEVLKP